MSVGQVFRSRVGDMVEKTIGTIRREAPVLTGVPQEITWYRIPLPYGRSGDGSEYHIYLKKGKGKDLCIFFSGGGVAWDEYTAAHPVTGGAVAAGEPNFYWNNLRPFTQIMNIDTGITEISGRNPFSDWSFIVIAYSTGDFHTGDSEFEYASDDGSRRILYFHGKRNVEESLKCAKEFFPDPERLLIAGDSAGGFAVPANAGKIAEEYYPDCTDITLLSDSALLPFRLWKRVARDVWKSDAALSDAIHSDNITLDWYEALHQRFGRRFRYLFACSTHDYLLSMYYNETQSGRYTTNREIQDEFNKMLKKMITRLKELEPEFGFYINNRRNLLYTKGGTVHTAVRESYFFSGKGNTRSMAEWLFDAVNGKVYSCGMELLSDSA